MYTRVHPLRITNGQDTGLPQPGRQQTLCPRLPAQPRCCPQNKGTHVSSDTFYYIDSDSWKNERVVKMQPGPCQTAPSSQVPAPAPREAASASGAAAPFPAAPGAGAVRRAAGARMGAVPPAGQRPLLPGPPACRSRCASGRPERAAAAGAQVTGPAALGQGGGSPPLLSPSPAGAVPPAQGRPPLARSPSSSAPPGKLGLGWSKAGDPRAPSEHAVGFLFPASYCCCCFLGPVVKPLLTHLKVGSDELGEELPNMGSGC